MTKNLRRAGGYSIVSDPEAPGGIGMECDTITCSHCQRIICLKPGSGFSTYLIYVPGDSMGKGHYREESGAFCGQCMHAICLPCHAAGRCIPWEKQLEAIESRDRMLREIGAVEA